METQFELSKLPIPIESIWDENDGETVLTLTSHGEYASGFLELQVEVAENGDIETGWKWIVNEPDQEEAYTGSSMYFRDAVDQLKDAMEDMDQYVRDKRAE